jgi:hypothetical protein
MLGTLQALVNRSQQWAPNEMYELRFEAPLDCLFYRKLYVWLSISLSVLIIHVANNDPK